MRRGAAHTNIIHKECDTVGAVLQSQLPQVFQRCIDTPALLPLSSSRCKWPMPPGRGGLSLCGLRAGNL